MLEGLFQPMHLLVIFAIALLVFGPKKLPELGKGIGEGIRALKDGMKEQASGPGNHRKYGGQEHHARGPFQPAQLTFFGSAFASGNAA